MSSAEASTGKVKPPILCVDDERSLLEGIALHLERRFSLTTATSGPEALAMLEAGFQPYVIVSDMRMPGMDGAAFLARSRAPAPDAVRMLLTGHTEIDAAIAAVNEGQIFRFLTKPCAPGPLVSAVTAGVDQYRLITAERVLLEQTLHGSIKALTDVLALTNPAAFGRANRLKTLVGELAQQSGLRVRWQVEVAAMLSQLAHITLSPETAEKLYFGRPLSQEEQHQVQGLPQVTEQLLGSIPRLEEVREILAGFTRPFLGAQVTACDPRAQPVQFASQLLRIAHDFDVLESQGQTSERALAALGHRQPGYPTEVMAALTALRGRAAAAEDVRELRLVELRPGMVLTEDVTMSNGMLLVARGYEITARLLERLHHLPRGYTKDKFMVVVKRG
jgi:CheY-like chemotaxis protein